MRAEPVPNHLAIIMDGNRRFAGAHGMNVPNGHAAGRDTLERVLDWCLEVGVRVLTVYALSTENFSRSPDEVEGLMELFDQALRDIATDPRVHRNQIRVRVLGNRELLPARVQEAIAIAERATEQYSAYRYNVALAYGGRDEILRAVRSLAQDVRDGKLEPDQIDSAAVSRRLYTADLPDPDLIFRTSGEE
ncbi:Di-trans-poly-cis-decaprenylcistransferase-like protein, partial [mine drainage metagenome]